jgi:hypothetical protein
VQRYKNLGGHSNVIAYEIEQKSIAVEFGDGSVYLYTIQSTGIANIAEMQRLANVGRGLNSFIGRVVKKGYARKIR